MINNGITSKTNSEIQIKEKSDYKITVTSKKITVRNNQNKELLLLENKFNLQDRQINIQEKNEINPLDPKKENLPLTNSKGIIFLSAVKTVILFCVKHSLSFILFSKAWAAVPQLLLAVICPGVGISAILAANPLARIIIGYALSYFITKLAQYITGQNKADNKSTFRITAEIGSVMASVLALAKIVSTHNPSTLLGMALLAYLTTLSINHQSKNTSTILAALAFISATSVGISIKQFGLLINPSQAFFYTLLSITLSLVVIAVKMIQKDLSELNSEIKLSPENKIKPIRNKLEEFKDQFGGCTNFITGKPQLMLNKKIFGYPVQLIHDNLNKAIQRKWILPFIWIALAKSFGMNAQGRTNYEQIALSLDRYALLLEHKEEIINEYKKVENGEISIKEADKFLNEKTGFTSHGDFNSALGCISNINNQLELIEKLYERVKDNPESLKEFFMIFAKEVVCLEARYDNFQKYLDNHPINEGENHQEAKKVKTYSLFGGTPIQRILMDIFEEWREENKENWENLEGQDFKDYIVELKVTNAKGEKVPLTELEGKNIKLESFKELKKKGTKAVNERMKNITIRQINDNDFEVFINYVEEDLMLI